MYAKGMCTREDFKMADVRERLARRNQERLQAIEIRKNQSDNKLEPEENKDLFKATFTKGNQELEDLLSQCQSIADGQDKQVVSQHFEKLSEKCQQLQKFLADSTMFLPAYDVKSAQDKLNALQQTINEERERLLPKKKFAFRTRKKQQDEQTADKKQVVDKLDGGLQEQGQKSLDNNLFAQKSFGLKAIKGKDLIMGESESSQQDIVLSDLDTCNIKVLGPPSALHINQLKNCTILCAPVSTAIFIDDCNNCTFVLACQQLRVHKTSECNFYLHVSSKAIVEDCMKVGFAPFLLEYQEKDKHFKAAGLDPKQNNWSLVNDFNWLCKDEHSPNWFIIDEDKRLNWSL